MNAINKTLTMNNTSKTSSLAINQIINTNDYLDIFDTNNNVYLFFNKESYFGLYSNTTNTPVWQIDEIGNITSPTISSIQNNITTNANNITTIQNNQTIDENNITVIQNKSNVYDMDSINKN